MLNLGSNSASATSFSINTGTDPVLELNLSSNLLELNLTPKPDVPVFNTTNLTVTAGTNNLTGYTLYMNVDNPNLNRTESLANNTTPSINSLTSNTEGYTESTFTTNSWGYHLTGETNYFAIPTTQFQLSTSTGPVNANSTTITFASKVDMNQPAGTYTTNMTLYAITNTPRPTMQDIDNWRGSLAENQSIRAIDSRDGKYYWVLKAKDGHIWMTQNLDFDIDSTKTYTPQDTDLTSNWTPIRSTIPSSSIATDGTIPGWTDDSNTPYSVDTGNWYWNNTWYSSNECLINDNTQTCNYLAGNANGKFSQTPYSGNGTHGHVGNYYNWSAAVAMNDTSSYTTSTYDNVANNPQTSICPAGWRLPTISSVASKNEFTNLLTAYGSGTSDDKILVGNPLFFVRDGITNSGILYNAGWGSFYLSSTVYSDKLSYFLYSYSGNVIPNDNRYNGRNKGWPVRCLARPANVITFNNNDGEGAMSAQVVKEGTTSTLKNNTLTRSGYKFIGWNTKPDGTGTPYANNATYTFNSDSEDIVLYAQWRELPAPGSFARAFSDADKTTITINNTEYYKMQDMTTDICSAVGQGQETQLVDTRDNKVYRVAKIADDKCWMTQNLNIAGGSTLTSATSNVTSNYTLPASSTSGFDSMSYSNAFVYNNGTYGGYYSYKAVTTGTNPDSGDAIVDICPKNWKLPNDADFEILKTIYTTGGDLVESIWHGMYGGMCANDSVLRNSGQDGGYWSSNSFNYARASILSFNKTSINMVSQNKAWAVNVRCIVK